MGLLFNTAATTEMTGKVNDAFASNIEYWKRYVRNFFDKPRNGGQPLRWIAGQNGLVPSAGFSSTIGQNWFKWLDEFEKDCSIRDLFFENLDPGARCREIIFSVVPKSSLPITMSTAKQNNGDRTYTLLVTIQTPDANTIRAAIRRKSRTRRRRRAGKK